MKHSCPCMQPPSQTMKTTSEQQEQELRELGRWINRHLLDGKAMDNPCTDPAVAMLVLEQLGEKTSWETWRSIGPPIKWTVANNHARASAGTLPEAICRFAKAFHDAMAMHEKIVGRGLL